MPDLTPEYAELRRLAEAANADVVQGATYQRDWPLSSRAVGQFLRALTPDLALELLNAAAERDALVDKVARVRTVGDLTARHIGKRVRVEDPAGGGRADGDVVELLVEARQVAEVDVRTRVLLRAADTLLDGLRDALEAHRAVAELDTRIAELEKELATARADRARVLAI